MSYLDLAKRIQAELATVKPRPDVRLTLVDTLEMLSLMHDSIRAEYIAGALPWVLDSDPDLARRFHQTESDIDQLAGTGPTEPAWRAALDAHRAVWREVVTRYRAHRERETEHLKADPMPKLPEGTTVAVGYSYGDGEPGIWEHVR